MFENEKYKEYLSTIVSLGSRKYYIQSAYAIPERENYEQETKPFEYTDVITSMSQDVCHLIPYLRSHLITLPKSLITCKGNWRAWYFIIKNSRDEVFYEYKDGQNILTINTKLS